MGCNYSTEPKLQPDTKNGVGTNKPKQLKDVNGSKKKKTRASRLSVAIKVGTGIRKSRVHASSTKIVLFLGGPKSGKGQVIEELVESFGVKVISAESLILKQLPHKIPNPNGGKLETAALMSMLRTQPNLITLEWIFELVKTEVLRFPDSVHVIDLLPNSKAILRNQKLFQDAGELLDKFEETCPVAFAMHLYIDRDNLNKQLDNAAHLTNPEGCTAAGVNDEADSAATKRRHAYFEEAVKPVIAHFKESDRLIEVDVSSMSHERIWFKVVRMFASFDMSERQNNNLIVIFVKETEGIQKLLDNSVRLIRMVDIVDEPDADFELLLECLIYQIGELGCPNVCYVVDIKDSTLDLCEDKTPQRSLVYELLDENCKLSTFLNKYQISMLTGDYDHLSYRGYKAPNNLTLLFTHDIPKRSCEVIATTYCSME